MCNNTRQRCVTVYRSYTVVVHCNLGKPKQRMSTMGESVSSKLSEKFKVLAEQAAVYDCKIANIFASFDDDEGKESFDLVLRSNASMSAIANALKEDGFVITRQYLAQKRKCYLTNDSCKCKGMAPK